MLKNILGESLVTMISGSEIVNILLTQLHKYELKRHTLIVKPWWSENSPILTHSVVSIIYFVLH